MHSLPLLGNKLEGGSGFTSPTSDSTIQKHFNKLMPLRLVAFVNIFILEEYQNIHTQNETVL